MTVMCLHKIVIRAVNKAICRCAGESCVKAEQLDNVINNRRCSDVTSSRDDVTARNDVTPIGRDVTTLPPSYDPLRSYDTCIDGGMGGYDSP